MTMAQLHAGVKRIQEKRKLKVFTPEEKEQLRKLRIGLTELESKYLYEQESLDAGEVVLPTWIVNKAIVKSAVEDQLKLYSKKN